MAIPDLTRAITYRGQDFNTITESNSGGQTVLQGCSVEVLDLSNVEIRQFGQPLALADGIDVGGVWLGARHVIMQGNVYGSSRGDCWDRAAAREAILLPQPSGQFGYYDFVFNTVTVGGVVEVTLSLRPGGMRYQVTRTKHGGPDANPVSLGWSCALYAKDPSTF